VRQLLLDVATGVLIIIIVTFFAALTYAAIQWIREDS
jgi:hypothetical protein